MRIAVFLALLATSCAPNSGAPNSGTECNDGVDNDGDGHVDWQLDLGCTGPGDNTEGGASNVIENGWTVFEASSDTVVVYVSSSTGDDSYTGLAPEYDGTDGPKATVSAAQTLLTDGAPDWLLFKRGDVFVGQTMGNWAFSGRSETEPQIIATYGDSTERPLFEVTDTWMLTQGGGGASENRSFVRIVGVHVRTVSKDPEDDRFTGHGGSCIQWLRDGGDVLIEDVRCDYAQLNIQSNPTLPFTIRRSVFDSNYALGAHAQNMFTNMHSDLVIEQNLFHHGGWSDVFRFAAFNPNPDHASWVSVTDGRIDVELDGTAYGLDGLDFSGTSDMQGVAEVLEIALNAAAASGAEVQFSAVGHAFQVRAPGYTRSADYGFATYSGGTAGTDLDSLIDLSSQGAPESTIFNRNMYLAHGEGHTTLRGNIDANGASGGTQLRMGGIAEDNLFLRNPHAIVYGSSLNTPNFTVGGVIRNNVVLGSRDIDTQVQGSGFVIVSNATTQSGGGGGGGGPSLIVDLEITGNIIAHQKLGSGNIKGIALQGSGAHTNVTVSNNTIYDWGRDTWPNPQDQRADAVRLDAATGSTVDFSDNLIQQTNGGFCVSSGNNAAGVTLTNNTYFSTAPDPPTIWSSGWFLLGSSVSMSEWLTATGETGATVEDLSFLDPTRDIDSYMDSIGGTATYDAFIVESLQQSKYDWRSEYTAIEVNAWIRTGFAVQ